MTKRLFTTKEVRAKKCLELVHTDSMEECLHDTTKRFHSKGPRTYGMQVT